jgi:hypothetical protein
MNDNASLLLTSISLYPIFRTSYFVLCISYFVLSTSYFVLRTFNLPTPQTYCKNTAS